MFLHRCSSQRVLSTEVSGFKDAVLPDPAKMGWRITIQNVEDAGTLWVVDQESYVEQLEFIEMSIELSLCHDTALDPHDAPPCEVIILLPKS